MTVPEVHSPDPAAPARVPLSILLLSMDTVNREHVAPILRHARLEVVRVSVLTPKWIAFAQRADAVIMVSARDPLAALVYALSAGIDTPIVVVSPQDLSVTAADLIGAGAFAYLRLPPYASDIAALVHALHTHRCHHTVDPQLRFVLDPISRTVHRGSKRARLSAIEFAILDYLSRHSGSPVAASVLANYVWCDRMLPRAKRALDVHVCHLRKKLVELTPDGAIVTIRGFGYMLIAGPGPETHNRADTMMTASAR